MKKILILGGTRFIGRNLLEKILPLEKYDITIFNRGLTNAAIFPEVNTIIGNRRNKEDLHQIASKDWDIVIDISGYWAVALEQQLQMWQGKIGKYIYISTSSHYKFDETNPHLIKEVEALIDYTDEDKHSDQPQHYNQNKAACENILQNQTKFDFVIFRPGLIIGKYDYTDRLYYWLYKAMHQKEILVGNNGENKLSFTYVTDLVDLIITAIETKNKYTVYNAASFITSIKNFIETTAEKMNKHITLIETTSDFLEEYNIKQWTDLPLYLNGNYLTINNSRIIKDMNFKFTQFDECLEQLLDYYTTFRKWEKPLTIPAAISNQRERELIAKLKTV